MIIVATNTDKKLTLLKYQFSQDPDEATIEKIKFTKSVNQIVFSGKKNKSN